MSRAASASTKAAVHAPRSRCAARGPFELIYRVRLDNRRTALRVEHAVKQLSRAEKSRIASVNPDAVTLLSMLGLEP